MIFPIIRVHPDTAPDTHYTEVLHAIQWDEITLGDWHPYADCVEELKEAMKK
jgi:hypothetical protein